MFNFRETDAVLKTRVEVDTILGAVSSCTLEISPPTLYFNTKDLRKLYADDSYPYASEEGFLEAVHARFKGCIVIAHSSMNRIEVQLNTENAQEILDQFSAVRAVADAKSIIPNR